MTVGPNQADIPNYLHSAGSRTLVGARYRWRWWVICAVVHSRGHIGSPTHPRAVPASEAGPALVRRVLVIAWSSLPAEEPDCGRGADHEDSDENACLE